ncbi:uncharacterized protein SCHCODRAFT_02158708 [Schizophyllum commune H4-8]|uniref:uncharacterized protein n=1 Tax=Schizophyllum commune (strain H4-8 / FGSC 9210) TaxID=578458 RepID=UPI00215E1C63|nr:uncharacterized protein SCHCODRAFT_02158708 [Schizophyllum commune H4-8]KAI5898194.1 hypothetical protein SCHCODRAFT_02158708 [Schizophyllum commune H4-8]
MRKQWTERLSATVLCSLIYASPIPLSGEIAHDGGHYGSPVASAPSDKREGGTINVAGAYMAIVISLTAVRSRDRMPDQSTITIEVEALREQH